MMESFKREETEVLMKSSNNWMAEVTLLKKTESDTLQLNETYRVLTDNQELDSHFQEIDCTSE